MSGMHPTLVIGLVGSFLWFFSVAIAAKRNIAVAMLYAIVGLAEWFALLFVFNVAPKIIPFADLPFLAFMDWHYFVILGLVPASLIVYLSGIWLKHALKDPSSLLGRAGKRADKPPASPAAGWAMDVLFPSLLSVVVFFGAQAYINADGGPYYRLGIITLLQILLICSFLHGFLLRPLFRKIWPHWWPLSLNALPSHDTQQNRMVADVNETPEQRTPRLRVTEISAQDSVMQEKLRDPHEPKGMCPNCRSLLTLSASECYKCKATFGEGSAWKIEPTKAS
ncbi:MAG: hypothetical protein MUF16_29185 [Burkholderiaceae bacterium]|nr:hypothetical protein [Burkholderiaceae bacterium]